MFFKNKFLISTCFLFIVLAGVGVIFANQSGIVIDFTFDEGNGTVVFDSSGYENDGNIHGAVWETENCISGNCLVFNESYIDVFQNPTLNPSDFTIEAWIYSFGGDYTNRTIINKDTTGAGTRSWRMHLEQNDWLVADIATGSYWSVPYSTTKIENNTWYYVAATYNHSEFCVWINGIISGCVQETHDIDYHWSQSKLIIGMSEDSDNKQMEYFYGIIDEVKLYNYAKTGEEILQSYNEYT